MKMASHYDEPLQSESYQSQPAVWMPATLLFCFSHLSQHCILPQRAVVLKEQGSKNVLLLQITCAASDKVSDRLVNTKQGETEYETYIH